VWQCSTQLQHHSRRFLTASFTLSHRRRSIALPTRDAPDRGSRERETLREAEGRTPVHRTGRADGLSGWNGRLAADVATRAMAERLKGEISARLGSAATLVEARPSLPVPRARRLPRCSCEGA
jgi:hypothetical protein